ncbi:MAG: hypothetical protein VB106_05635 [Clostridiaceae bacterium]|nr:hypothetical protein [Clostridiaceae bacterium]
MNKHDQTKFYWEINVPIFRNNVILKDLGIALGIPFGLLILILFVVSGGDISAGGILYPLISIGILFISGFLFIMLVYGGSYSAGYIIDKNGILNYTQRKQAKKNTIINTLLVVIGLFSKSPSTAGTGLLAQTRQSQFLTWKGIRKVKVYPESRSIVIRGSFTEKIAVFCSEDNFYFVKDIILSKSSKTGG